MLLIALLLAAVQEGPKLGKPIGNVSQWIRASDQPRYATGAVRFKVLFTPDGKPDRCEIVATTGDREVEKAACTAVNRRFRYEPSFSATGEPVYRIMERAGYFGLDGPATAHIRLPAMYDLREQQTADPETLDLLVEINEAGTIATCGLWEKSPEPKEAGEVACKKMADRWKPLPETNSAGRPVRYFRSIILVP